MQELAREAADSRQRLVDETELRAKLSIEEANNKTLRNRAAIFLQRRSVRLSLTNFTLRTA